MGIFFSFDRIWNESSVNGKCSLGFNGRCVKEYVYTLAIHILSFGFLIRVWRSIVRKGDTVVDATCRNNNDTFAMLKMVADERVQGRVYGLDIQESAIASTSSFLKMAVNSHEVCI